MSFKLKNTILLIGYGSIGKRYAEILSLQNKVVVYDKNYSAYDSNSEGRNLFFTKELETVLSEKINGVVVATPPDSHDYYADYFKKFEAPLLIEKPLANNLSSAQNILATSQNRNSPTFVVCNMRYHHGITTIEKNIPLLGQIYNVKVCFENDLRNMRPSIDYRKTYAASLDSGGCILDCIHELDYVNFLFGISSIHSGRAIKLSDLEIEREDCANFSLDLNNRAVCEVSLNYFSLVKIRSCRVTGEYGVIDWFSIGKNPEKCKVVLYKTDETKILFESKDLLNNAPYNKMLADFTYVVEGGDKSNTKLQSVEQALHSLQLALKMREMS